MPKIIKCPYCGVVQRMRNDAVTCEKWACRKKHQRKNKRDKQMITKEKFTNSWIKNDNGKLYNLYIKASKHYGCWSVCGEDLSLASHIKCTYTANSGEILIAFKPKDEPLLPLTHKEITLSDFQPNASEIKRRDDEHSNDKDPAELATWQDTIQEGSPYVFVYESINEITIENMPNDKFIEMCHLVTSLTQEQKK